MFTQNTTTAKLGEDILPLEVGYLPEIYKKKAEVELHYTPDRREDCLRQIKEMMKSDETLKDVPITDSFLQVFLISKKCDVLKAFSQIKLYLDFNRKHPDIFTDQRFDVLANFMTRKYASVLPWRCQDGCTLILVQTANWNSKDLSADGLKKFYSVLLMQSLREPMTQVNGFKVIIDFSTVPLSLLRISTPQNLYLQYYGSQVVIPGRFKAMHIIKMNLVGRILWDMTKIFMNEKFKTRAHFHSTYETLFDFFPRAILPMEIGGDLKDYDMTEWLRKYTSPEELAFLDGKSSSFPK